jgi:hypothetical protein
MGFAEGVQKMNNYWNGEGKPSVGDKNIEVFNDYLSNPEYAKCEIIFISEFSVIYKYTICCVEFAVSLHHCKFRVTPNPKETAKQKAIDEIVNELFTINKIFKQENIAEFIYDNYTKSKVKPLPKDWYDLHRNYLDSHQLSVYEWLIENGYCRGSADDE